MSQSTIRRDLRQDPSAGDRPGTFEDYEFLFCSAYEHAFGRPASSERVKPYLLRYFRFGVVPVWVRCYVRTELRGQAVANIGHAPLDPVIDYREWFRSLTERFWFAPRTPRRAGIARGFFQA